MDRFYVVAKLDLEPEYPHSNDWPKVIAYSYKTNSFMLAEGKGHGFKGIIVTQLEARNAIWNHLFSELKAQWILDRLSSCSFANEADCAQSITSKHGSLEVIRS